MNPLTKDIVYPLLFLAILLSSCTKEVAEQENHTSEQTILNLPSTPFNYAEPDLPEFFEENGFVGSFQSSLALVDNTPADNPVTDAGATLGRVLFYDKALSQNFTVSCATCHQQSYGFSDPLTFSEGFDGGLTGRHSMGLANAAYYGRGRFFWDERAETLEQQVLMPIQDEVEMGLSLDTMIARITGLSYYNPLFLEAFGTETVTADHVAKALAQFVRSMVSYRSPYDLGRAQVESPYDDFPNFTEEENLGKHLFIAPLDQGGLSCIDCHSTDGFVNISVGPLSNGLDTPQEAQDVGHYSVTGNPNDLHTFKTASFKNIALRPPYMHDGRFNSLEEVIEHYSTGIKNHPNLNFSLLDEQGLARQFNLSQQEKDALISFFHTLTDGPMISDEKFSDPFSD